MAGGTFDFRALSWIAHIFLMFYTPGDNGKEA